MIKISTIFFLLLSLFGLLNCYSAVSQPTDTFYKPSTHNSISVMKNGENLDDSKNIGLFTGSVNFSYLVPVPKGTNGVQPDIKVTYDSQSGFLLPSILGHGWSISLSYIKRNIEYTKSDTSDDTYQLSLNGAIYKLIYNPAENKYHTQRESFFNIQKVSGGGNELLEYWVVKLKDGTTYRFGYNSDSELVSNGGNYVAVWHLDKITDTYGNSIYFNYLENPYPSDFGAVYPDSIQYNNDKLREIVFEYESSDRPDSRSVYDQGNRVEFKRRLKQIHVRANELLIRKIAFGYQTGEPSSISLLTSITEYGNDGVTVKESTEFDYFPLVKEWELDARFALPVTFSGIQDTGARFADINRDGYIDFLKGYKFDYDDSAPEDTTIWINTKSGWQLDSSRSFPYSFTRVAQYYLCESNRYQYGVDRGFRLLDVNSDGFIDLFMDPHRDVAGSIDKNISRQTILGDGLQWVENSDWLPPDLDTVYWSGSDWYCQRVYGIDTGTRFLDINGDGWVDILRNGVVNTYYNNKRLLNTKSGWEETSDWSIYDNISENLNVDILNCDTWQYGVDRGLRFVDVNGDGLVDILTSRDFFIRWDDGETWDDSLKAVHLNNGQNFVQDNAYNIPLNFVKNEMWIPICESKLGVDQGVRFADLNGDGLVDILKADSSTKQIWLNNGKGWVLSSSWDIPIAFIDSDGENLGVRLVDLNGDGLVDIVEGRGTNRAWINKAQKSYLLKQIKYPMGGITSFDYTQSTDFDNTGNDDISDLGFNVWLVNSATYYNGLSGDAQTLSTYTYSYSGGKFDYTEREFMGFARVDTLSLSGRKSTHMFYQDIGRKGLEYRTEISNIDSILYSITEKYYSVVNANDIFVVTLDSLNESVYDGQSSDPKIRKTDYKYDDFGNVTNTLFWGDISFMGDERFDFAEYMIDEANWIIEKPSHTYVSDASGEVYQETNLTYNDNGSLESKESIIFDGPNPVTQFAYNSYGNCISKTGPRGYTTYYEYDYSQTFKTVILNALGQETQFNYDMGTSNLLSRTDPNNITTTFSYDIFGRKVKEVLPYDTFEQPTIEYLYDYDGIPPEKQIIKHKENDKGTLDSYNFYDGFNKLVQAKQESQSSSYITKDIFYDYEGRIAGESNPYYSNSQNYTMPDVSVSRTSIAYDPPGRVTKVIRPDGASQLFIHAPWQKTAVDENGHSKTYLYNAYGQIIQVEEGEIGARQYTQYQYDPLGNITSIIDDNQNQLEFIYDKLGRIIENKSADVGIVKYEYDLDGNLVSQIDSLTHQKFLTYDELNRLQSETNLEGVIIYTYDQDKIGVLTNVVTPSISKFFDYDDRLRTKNEKKIIDNIHFDFSYSYDSMNRLVAKTLPNGETVRYNYNQQGILDSIPGVINNFTYNEIGKETEVYYANDFISEYSYNPENYWLTGLNSSSILEYTHDPKGNIISIANQTNGVTKNYSYDVLDRLSEAETFNSENETLYHLVYSYDNIHNMTSIVSDLYGISYSYYSKVHAPSSIQKEDNPEAETWYRDLDGDGYGDAYSPVVASARPPNCVSNNTDCNDSDSSVFQSNIWYRDFDDDGYSDGTTLEACVGSLLHYRLFFDLVNSEPDCNDSNAQINPGATEITGDGVDQNCDARELCYVDVDDDTYRPDDISTIVSLDLDCTDTGEAVSTDLVGDCNDSNAQINPGATEITGDGVDQNCDARELCYVDVDDDTYRPDDISTIVSLDLDCTDTGEAVSTDLVGDCNDSNAQINPGATEITGDGVDQNCDARELCYVDVDDDTYRPDDISTIVSLDLDCTDTGEAVSTDLVGDCNDSNAQINPGATEITGDGVDQNCDARELCYVDVDDDTYRPDDISTIVSLDLDCTDTGEAVSTDLVGDCNDSNAQINPGATEITGDGVDQNCDARELCYVDVDDDTYRPDDISTIVSLDLDCTDTGEAVSTDLVGDCNDSNAQINPGATEITGDGVDQNCDARELCYVDVDDDTYRPDDISTIVSLDLDCTDTGEAVSTDLVGDCNDSNAQINPGATEITGDGVDQNCDARELCYVDVDDDTYRPDDISTIVSLDLDCTDTGEAYGINPIADCDDNNAEIYPGAIEIPGDGIDQNCDGLDSFVLAVNVWGGGTVVSDQAGISCPEDCEEPYSYNIEITLISKPGKGSRFLEWEGDCIGKEATCTVTVDKKKEVIAHFREIFPWELFRPAITKSDGPRTVISAGQIWMDRNLGASRVARSLTDTEAFGDLYQWGRLADGHENRLSPVIKTLSANDTPGHGNFIASWGESTDWRLPKNDNLWQGAHGTNNPCPSGFRIPTAAEWQKEIDSWELVNTLTLFESPLKLTLSGFRSRYHGDLFVQNYGYYWSSTVNGNSVMGLSLWGYDTDPPMYSAEIKDYYSRGSGYSVRCIKD